MGKDVPYTKRSKRQEQSGVGTMSQQCTNMKLKPILRLQVEGKKKQWEMLLMLVPWCECKAKTQFYLPAKMMLKEKNKQGGHKINPHIWWHCSEPRRSINEALGHLWPHKEKLTYAEFTCGPKTLNKMYTEKWLSASHRNWVTLKW